MLQMKIETDYVVVDTQEWIDDRVNGVNDEATEAFETFESDKYESEKLVDWLASLDGTGIYGEGGPMQVATINEENFLTEDVILTYAKTEEYGDLLCVQWGYRTTGTVTIYTFNGDDDSDWLDYAHGYASCDMQVHIRPSEDAKWPYGGCDAEWIIEDACNIWQNGGGQTERIADVIVEGDLGPHAICPRCQIGNLTFWAR